MKKTFTSILIILALSSQAQITLDHAYNLTHAGLISTLNIRFSMVKLSNSGYKYVLPDLSNSQIILYNLNHTIFKNLILPITDSTNNYFYDISEDLFDTDTSTVEYLLYNYAIKKITIADESGAILFSQDTAQLAGYKFNGSDHLVYTPNGVRLLLASTVTPTVYTYSLPGQITCADCSNGIISGIIRPSNNLNFDSNIYPNPSNDKITIDYTLPPDINNAELKIYDLKGDLLRTYNINKHMRQIIFTKTELNLSGGMYFYKISSKNSQISNGKFMIE